MKVVNILKHSYRPGTFTPDMEKAVEENQGGICPLIDMKPAVSSHFDFKKNYGNL